MPDTRIEELAAEAASVAFEVDAADEATRTGWSVVVRGTLTEVSDPGDLDGLPFTWWG